MRFIKILMCSVLMLMLAAMPFLTASAGEEEFTFALTTSGDSYSVTGYSGSDEDVIVPGWYMGKPVTAISEGAFQGNATMMTVSLPSSVKRIGISGFQGCTSLTDISSYIAPSGIRIPGDADDNGAVNLADALHLLRYSAGETAAINLSNADVNADGRADLNDALLLLQFEAGWDAELK